MKQCGIYQIFNTKNQKKYVGQSINIPERLSGHKSQLKNNKHTNSHLQNSWNKYGEEAFEFKILKVCKPRYLDRFEKLYIRVWDLQNPEKGYNKESGGHLNKEISKETKRKISEKTKGENHPFFGKKRPEHSEKMKGRTPWNKSKPLSEEHKRKISENNARYWKGKKQSDEHKRKNSKTTSEKYNTTGFYRVSIKNNLLCKKGFTWAYQHNLNSQRKTISSTDLNKLKEKVLEQGLEWKIIDEEKAKQSLKKDISDENE